MYFNTSTKAFGLSIDDVRRAHPESSIPDGISFGGFVPYEPSAVPEHNVFTHEAREVVPVKVAGVLTQQWAVAPRAAPIVPARVTRRQARQALLLAGLLEHVPTALAAIEDPIQRGMAEIEWADATDFDRDRPLLVALATALGLDGPGLDNLFIRAAQL